MRKFKKFRVGLVAVAVMSAVGLSVGSLPAQAAGPCNDGQNSTTYPPTQYGICYAGQQPEVLNNVWNANAQGLISAKQTITPTSQTKWTVASAINYPGNEVISYPNSQYSYNSLQIEQGQVRNLYSSWHSGLPSNEASGDHYESAYDLYLGGAQTQEVMIWTDVYSMTPAGSDTGKVWTDPSYGNKYHVWDNSDGSIVTFYPEVSSHTGSVNMLAAIQWELGNVLTDNTYGYLSQIGYGFEVRNTQGNSKTFTLAGLSVTEN